MGAVQCDMLQVVEYHLINVAYCFTALQTQLL